MKPEATVNNDHDDSEDERPITVLALATFRGAKEDADGAIGGGEFQRVGLPIVGGCQGCGACIAAWNAFPSTTGYLRCAECIGDYGYLTAEEANRAIFPHEYDTDRDDPCFDGDDLGCDGCCEDCGGPLTDMGAHGVGCEGCGEAEIARLSEQDFEDLH